jgi:GNAT superfamily N-acetyltransferase
MKAPILNGASRLRDLGEGVEPVPAARNAAAPRATTVREMNAGPRAGKGATLRIKCFGCEAMIEAGDADAVSDAFVLHAHSSHTWSYPEQALRDYARNYGEATERLVGSTERLVAIGEVSIHPVTPERVDEWLGFFDREAFAGNPIWASCYCLEPHAPSTPEEPERPWRATRAAMAQRLRCNATTGYLAFVDGRPAGWVNASWRSEYGLYRSVDPGGPEPTSVIGVSCFVIAPPFRRHGIASALLDRVIADAAGRGASCVEGYPHNQPDANDPGHFRGARSMYAARGFEVVETRERDTVMRLSVGPARTTPTGA